MYNSVKHYSVNNENEFTPPDLHDDYDWTDGLCPNCFSTSRTKLGGTLFEELLQHNPEVGVELKRLAMLGYAEVHQHKLRSLIKITFDTEYLTALNSGAVGTEKWEQWKQEYTEQYHAYSHKYYYDNPARASSELAKFTERLAETEKHNQPRTDSDPNYQYTRSHVHRHCDVIAYWCMADFSRYPECWYHTPAPKEPVISLWDMELRQNQEAEQNRVHPVSGDMVKARRNVNKYGKPVKPALTPEQLIEQEKQRREQAEADRLVEEELARLTAANERKLRRKQEHVDNDPRIIISVVTGDDLVIAAPTTAADLAVRYGRKKRVEVPEFKTFKRKVVVPKKKDES